MKNIVKVLIILVLITLTGCWDLTEIEEIGFLLAVGLDPLEEDELQREVEKLEKETGQPVPKHEDIKHLFKSTYQLAVPGNLGDVTEGGSQRKAFHNITTIGMTNFKINRMFSSRVSRSINFEHLKVLIIHQELARQGFLEHLADFFIRDHEMRRRTQVFISDGLTKDILDDEHPVEDIVASSIMAISENYEKVLAMVRTVDIGEVTEFIIGDRSFLVPRIVSHGKGGAKISGAAVFSGKTNKMQGWLGEEEIRAYNWIMGLVEAGAFEVPYEKQMFVYENTSEATTVNYERKNGQDVFNVDIRSEGLFVENWIHKIEINDQETLDELGEAVAKRIEDVTERLIHKMQNEYHADIFEFFTKVKQKDYAYWKEVRDKWDGEHGAFSKAKINVTVKIEIRHYMLNEKLEE